MKRCTSTFQIINLCLLGCTLALVSCAEPKSDGPSPVWQLADEYLEATLERYPEVATYYGMEGRRHDRLVDNSLAALEDWQGREDEWLDRLQSLPVSAPPGSAEWAVRGILLETLQASQAIRVCRDELWDVDQTGGWQTFLPYVAEVQPLATDELRKQALARARDTVRFLDTEIINLKEGLALGYTSPQRNVVLVVQQLQGLLEPDSPLASPAQRDSDPTFQADYRHVLEQEIHPALRRYVKFLETEYAPATREAIAVASNPNGEQCYRATIRLHSTLDVAPQAIHDLGLQQMATIQSEMRAIAKQSFDTEDLPLLLQRLTTEPQFAFSTREEIIEFAQAALERAQEAMPRFFGIQPRSAVAIEPYPAYRENAGTGEYQSPSEDGSRPGLFYIPVKDPETRPRTTYESLTFHETIPGHHLQGAIAIEAGNRTHPLTRYLDFPGFSEGWGLYSDRLADEMGLYSSDLDRMGMLGDQAARAARLVIDTGIHQFGWTRQQAVDYMIAHTTWAPQDIEAEIDRYIIFPGQATAYMLGMLKIRQLRQEAETTLGDAFQIRDFHDQILEEGALPLLLLEEKVKHWIAQGP